MPRSAGPGTRHATLDQQLRSRLAAVAERGLAAAAAALAGDDLASVRVTLRRWREQGHPELPWLAGPGLTALGDIGVDVPPDGEAAVIKRFVAGAEVDEAAVRDVVARADTDRVGQAEAIPPDARAALFAAVERYFEVLHDAYTELGAGVREDRRPAVDEAAVRWQARLEAAAQQITERARVVLGLRAHARAHAPPARPQRRHRDRPAFTLVFVLLALLAAAVILWAASQGWPVEPVRFDL